MIIALSAAALIISAQVTSPTVATPDAGTATSSSEVAETARQFLLLLDERRWAESYQATSASFRELNTVQAWIAASEKARVPLGAAISRTLVSQENLPAPPDGYEVVKFRTSYANKAGALETVSLRRENGIWRVAGVMID